ncbi:MAG TPA: histidine kinase dimerization/phospho-acceptor domain-containing protein [Capillimicrobium sp.]|nr:histidine kinase dimerization/phospho-acceptor domain-containing protein [Capillimicrobium sp.]
MAADAREGEIVRRLVHDLRTPLAVVAGFAELLDQRAGELTDEQRAEYVARILDGARQMDEILGRARAGA